MRHETINRIQRSLLLISFLSVLGIGLIGARVVGIGLPGLDGLSLQGFERSAFNKQVGLISGHAGFDSGAVCTGADGEVTVTEAKINAGITGIVAKRLQRAGADVTILEEYDPRLAGLRMDVLLSLHADSCIDATGFKAAYSVNSHIPVEEERFLRRRRARAYHRPVAHDVVLNRRLDPPDGISRETHTAIRVELVGGLHQAK